MFFYIDESGNTGKNLFDPNQRYLYYGLLSSKTNIDILAKRDFSKIKNKLGLGFLHANELNISKILELTREMPFFQKKYKLRFDLFRVVKSDHAIISFFDQIFDQGVNPAFTWTGYWTPLRYVILLKLATLFDIDTLKKAWEARISLNCRKAEQLIIQVCNTLEERVSILPDERSRKLIGDTLRWAKYNYSKLSYNATNKEAARQIMPNVICFQFVLGHIASYIAKHGKQPSQIIIDRQVEFNKSQQYLADYYAVLQKKKAIFLRGPGLPTHDYRNMPIIPLTISSRNESFGVEIVDIFLWIFQRAIERQDLPKELQSFFYKNYRNATFEEISLEAINSKCIEWLNNMPPLTPEQISVGEELAAIEEERRLLAINNN